MSFSREVTLDEVERVLILDRDRQQRVKERLGYCVRGARRANVTGLGGRKPRVEELALPKYVESGISASTRPSSGGCRLNRSWSEALVRRNENRSSFLAHVRMERDRQLTRLSRFAE